MTLEVDLPVYYLKKYMKRKHREVTMTDSWRNGVSSYSGAMYYVFKNNLFSDCTFLVGQERKEFKAHTFVLTCVSPVFEAMLNGPMKPVDNVIELPDSDPTSFALFLEMVYSEEDKFSSDMLDNLNVLYLASKYMVKPIIKSCIKYILENINFLYAANAYEYLRLLGFNEEAEQCLEIVMNDTSMVIKSEHFTRIDKETLFTILELDCLTVNSELELYSAAMRWIEAKLQDSVDTSEHDKEALFVEVLSHIRFLNMTAEEFDEGPGQNSNIPIEDRKLIRSKLISKGEWPPHISTKKRLFKTPGDCKDKIVKAVKADITKRLGAVETGESADPTVK